MRNPFSLSFRDLPIRRKLVWVTLCTCGIALTFACGSLFWFISVQFRKSFSAELQSIGEITAQNCVAPLAFNDSRSADAVLGALKVKSSIVGAYVFDSQNKIFGVFRTETNGSAIVPGTANGAVTFANGYASLNLPIRDETAVLGSLHLRANFQKSHTQLLVVYASVMMTILFGSTLLILALSSFMKRLIATPIVTLARVAREITDSGQYADRAPEAGRDEVGRLTRDFNRMLDQIQSRDIKLREINRSLAEEIGERKIAEAARHRLTAIIEATIDFVSSAKPDGSCLFVNRAGLRMAGFEEDVDITRFKTTDFHPGWAMRIIEEEALPTAARDGSWIGETAVFTRDGREVPVSQLVLSHRSPDGAVEFFSTIARDISVRKTADLELAKLNRQLVVASRQAGMVEVATSVLHNVGNVLNSINVSTNLITEQIRRSKITSLAKAAQLLRDHQSDLGEYLTRDPKGQQVPGFLDAIAVQLAREHAALADEARGLQLSVEHVKKIVAMQQSYAKVAGILEKIAIEELVEDALRISANTLSGQQIEISREFESVPPILVDHHTVLQILVNLINNAKQALEYRKEDRCLVLRIDRAESGGVRVEVTDNGIGIPNENLTRIFQYGFTTKENGHGFGLHSGAIAAREMGGSLNARSGGSGAGATFILELPTKPIASKVANSFVNTTVRA
ncbi:MAG: Histidine kinase [Verrucomicrobiales bacterium]|nr:Histidine kinase [Verrucomicrobiales bacterium]